MADQKINRLHIHRRKSHIRYRDAERKSDWRVLVGSS